MKYRRLTKEQFEALSVEFAQFLASQSIDHNQWQAIKNNEPHRVEAQLDAFSDLVWEESLRKTCFINHFSPGGVFTFHAGQMSLTLLGVKTTTDLDFNDPESWQWLSEHWQDDSVSFYREQKPYDNERTQVLFALIERGGILSTGAIAERLEAFIPENHS
jgi:hypothetical protein